jgi:GNAT superfamily N-acetyltransferase
VFVVKMIRDFFDLWKAHYDWNLGVLLKKIISLKTAEIYIGYTQDEWFNFALPKVQKPKELDLTEIKEVLSPANPRTTIYLLEEQVNLGFPKFLLENEFELFGEDNWLVFKPSFKDLETDTCVERIGINKFSDYDRVTVEAYKEVFGFDDRLYNEACQRFLIGEVKSKNPNLSAEFFMVYDQGEPAAGAGLFLTEELGYFHNDATTKKFRKKGYHTALIKERIKFCKKRGIKTLYAIVDGETSLKNYSRCGFEPWQVASLFTLK